jgi:hypothetical protein
MKIVVSQEDYQARMRTCENCEKFDAKWKRCNSCGCFLVVKLRIAGVKCPLNKWGPVTK